MNKETIDQIQAMFVSIEKLKSDKVNQIIVSDEQLKSLESLVVVYMTAATVDDKSLQALIIGQLDKIWDGFIVTNQDGV